MEVAGVIGAMTFNNTNNQSTAIFLPFLCGDSVFWDWNQSWNTASPRLSFCFLHSIPTLIPCIFLILGTLAAIKALTGNGGLTPTTWRSLPVRVQFWLSVKFVLSVVVAVAAILVLTLHIKSFTLARLPPFAYLAPTLLILCSALAWIVAFKEAANASLPLGLLLFFFWTLMSMLQSVVLLQSIPSMLQWSASATSNATSNDRRMDEEPLDLHYGVCSAVVFVASIAMLMLNCFNLSVPRSKSPFDKASTASRLVHAWITPLLLRGFKKNLEQEDLDELPPDCKSRHLSDTFHERWRLTSKTKGEHQCTFKKTKGFFSSRYLKSEDEEPLITKDDLEMDHTNAIKRQRFYRTQDTNSDGIESKSASLNVLSCYKWNVFWVSMLHVVRINLEIVKPLLLGKLLKHFDQRNDSTMTSEEWAWKGMFYVVTLSFCNFMESSILVFYLWCGNVLGLKFDRMLKTAVFSKSMKLSVKSREKSTVGEMVNLISQDATKFQMLVFFLEGVVIPVELVVYAYLLWQQLGPSFLFGLVLLCVLVPSTILITRKQKASQREFMKIKDSRVKIIHEILNGIKILKLYAWEEAFLNNIRKVRTSEIDMRKKVLRYDILNSFTTRLSAIIVQAVSITAFALVSGKILTPEIVFVALGLFSNMKDRLLWLPDCIIQSVQIWVAGNRIDEYMRREEIFDYVMEPSNPKHSVILLNGSFEWGKSQEPTLKSISFDLKKGESAMVIGKVGSGKSSFLMSLLGEMIKLKGKVYKEKRVAFVGEQPWIQNASLRNNVLFGKAFDRAKYQLVLEACALLPDLTVLPAGDETEIGEKGVNLSGGQKARVALARAVYDDADLYLFDNPLSAVDAHVGRHIFDKVIGPFGILKNKSRVLVSNNMIYSKDVDNIVCLKEGSIYDIGSYKQLSKLNGYFSAIEKECHRGKEEKNVESQNIICGNAQKTLNEKGTLVRKEENRHGEVKCSVYWNYIKALGLNVCLGGILSIFFGQLFEVLIGIWLAKWTDEIESEKRSHESNKTLFSPKFEGNLTNSTYYIVIYNLLSLLVCFLVVGRRIADYIGTAKTSYFFHERLSTQIMRYPMSFFETTPVGRIINRFSNDIDAVDCRITTLLLRFFESLITVLLFIAAICFIHPLILPLVPILLLSFWLLKKLYIPASRQVRRLKSISMSFVLSHFSQTQLGLVTIRAFQKQEEFTEKWHNYLDEFSKTQYTFIASNIWLSFLISITSTLVLFFCGFLSVLGNAATTGLIGVSLTYSFGVCKRLGATIRTAAKLEQDLVSVERLEEFSSLKEERKRRSSKTFQTLKKFKSGCLNVKNYSTRYREGFDNILSRINFMVQPGEKIGIVGRTGAGKSTFTIALFRIVEATEGKILIDSQNTAKMGLFDLRSSLSIIPQDAVVFSGTLRHNLDPFECNDDATIWKAIEMAHLKEFVSELPDGLNYVCTEYGSNLSAGQKQLLCLARALLRKSKILVLDEATSAVDPLTDDLIQATIREQFKDCTVLTVAHRINTVLDYDKILVLDKGEIKEYDNPKALLEDETSMFYSLAKQSGLI